jgi:glycosyltransferase involved in cell wall biosynthesis
MPETLQGPPPIAVAGVIMTKNAANHIEACVASLKGVLAEIWVVDSHSRDKTVELARAAGAKILFYQWDGGYPKKKEWCLRHLPTTFEWIFYLDADERLSQELAQELRQTFKTMPFYDAYWVPSHLEWLGTRLYYGGPQRKIALLRRHKAYFPAYQDAVLYHTGYTVGVIGEVEGHYQPTVPSALVGQLRAPLLHKATEPLAAWFARHAGYAAWMAAIPSANWQGEVGWRRVAKRAILTLPWAGVWVFCYHYLLYQGWRDGRAGFDYAIAQGFYYWQISLARRALKRQHSKTKL